MDRFPRRQFLGRSPGPPASAAADGLAQGMAYTAIVQSAATNNECTVSIPALHLSETFTAHVPVGGTVTKGETVLVLFDEQKRPWVTVGGSNPKIAALEQVAPFGTVSSLPAEPTDGQVINYLADATNGIVWRLRYRVASASTHKWEFVGGPAMYNEVAAEQATASATFVDLATVGPSVTAPLAGDYLVALGTRQLPAAAGFAETELFIGGVGTPALVVTGNTASEQASVSRQYRANGVAAEAILRLKYLSTTVSGSTFLERWLTILPVRVG